jgi:hypothetical protein
VGYYARTEGFYTKLFEKNGLEIILRERVALQVAFAKQDNPTKNVYDIFSVIWALRRK